MTDRSRLRLVVLGVLVLSLVATLVGRLWYLQVLAAPQFRNEAHQNHVKDIVTQAPRGQIVDDKGRPLVTNKTALVVSVDRNTLLAQPDGGVAVLHRLSRLLHKPYQRLVDETTPCNYKTVPATPPHCYNGSPYQPIPVSTLKPNDASTMQAIRIQELQEKYPGVAAQLTAVRHYPKPAGALASTVLGYTGPITQADLKKMSPSQQDVWRNSQVGYTGLEASYDKYLRGQPGVQQVAVNHVGTVTGTIKNTQARQGDDVVTNLDAKAQATLERQLKDAITYARHNGYTADYAAGVVLNARTGGVVAMGSEPTYDPNKPPAAYKSTRKFKRYANSEGHPFVDKAYGSANPPGSTFKGISSSGLLWDHTMSTDRTYDCPTTYGGRHNFDGEGGKGFISLHEAIVISCDTFFFQLGYQDWVRDNNLVQAGKKPLEGVQKIARDYGMASNPHLDLPGAAYGHIGDRRNTKLFWKHNAHKGLNYCKGARTRPKGTYLQQLDSEFCQSGYVFRSGDQENEDIGQGTVLVSPLQLAVAYAAIGNGGTVYEPHVAKAIVSPTGKLVKRIKPVVKDHIPLPAADLDYLRQAFLGVTNEPSGTGSFAFAGWPMNKVPVGGKTGTAELSGTNQNGCWFVSFGGPAGQKPQYVVAIEVNKADQGAVNAAPYVRNMWNALYGYGVPHAIFKNGVPPHKLPKVGVAALRQQLARRQARHHRQQQRKQQQQQNQTSPSPRTGTLSPSPSTSTSTSPSTSAAGLPPAIVDNRRWGLGP
ncbi:MAG TPA: penicillin-binding transpeptidase domain-containing protein [Mycobacteriales bacterium]|nr:penicillin-binding transpeptidase domain-containing protein [Mycobacteriales bacterium]